MGGLARENYELKNQVNMKLPDFNNCIVVRLNKYLCRSLGGEDPLEKEMATYSSVLAWTIPWTEEPGSLWPVVSQDSQT